MDYGNGMPTNKPSAVFDPFHITANHSKHSQLCKIIRLEESNRLFCPLCLEETASTNTQNIENQHIEQYVQNLFEALDQNYEVLQLKCIILKILEITFRRRPGIEIRDDNDFHNYLRVLYKLLNGIDFSPLDYPSIAEIFASLTNKFNTQNPIPFVSVWKTSRCLLDYAKKHLFETDLKQYSEEDIFTFMGSAALIIKTFLHLLNAHMVDQTIDLIFPVYDREPIFQSRRWFINGQEECLKFIYECLHSSYCSKTIGKEHALLQYETAMVARIFEALVESFSAAIRLKSNLILEVLNRIDCLKVAHLLIYRNKDKEFRGSIRLFLRKYVMYYTEKFCGSDEFSKSFFDDDDIVELNHKNAIAYSYNSMKSKRTVFYLLVNNIARRTNSGYYNEGRIKKVIKCIEPEKMGMDKSKTFVRAYMMLLVKLAKRITSFNTAEKFIRKVMTDSTVMGLNENFCFEREVFFWIYEDWQFVKQLDTTSLDCIINKSIENNSLCRDLTNLIKSKHYKALIISYTQNENLVMKLIHELLKADSAEELHIPVCIEHEHVISHIGFNMLAQFHSSILESLNVTFSFNDEEPKFGMITPLLTIIRGCKHFKFVLDMHFIRDFFKLLEVLYKRKTGEKKIRLLTICTEFIICLIETDIQCIMKLIKHMNYRILGYMFNYLGNRPSDNSLSETIAHLLVAYDKLDYPFLNYIGDIFHPLAANLIRWTWSNNQNLHYLAILIMKRTLNSTLDYTTRLCLTTGLLHILYSKSNVINDPACLRIITSLMDLEVVKNNPLLCQNVPHDAPEVLKKKATETTTQPERSMSPMSFSSESETRSLMDDTHQNVFNILNGLIQDDQDLTSNISQENLLARSLNHDGIERTEDWDEIQCVIPN